MVAPSMPSVGLEPAAFAPAPLMNAWLNPAAVGSKNEPNAPSQSDRTPTLMVPPLELPELSFFAALSELSSLDPHPAVSPSARHALPRANHFRPVNAPSPLMRLLDDCSRRPASHRRLHHGDAIGPAPARQGPSGRRARRGRSRGRRLR